jgi:hypothetical protein
MKLAQAKANICLAPALVETYSRLLIYTEIESLGIKGFMSNFLCDFLNNFWINVAIKISNYILIFSATVGHSLEKSSVGYITYFAGNVYLCKSYVNH